MLVTKAKTKNLLIYLSTEGSAVVVEVIQITRSWNVFPSSLQKTKPVMKSSFKKMSCAVSFECYSFWLNVVQWEKAALYFPSFRQRPPFFINTHTHIYGWAQKHSYMVQQTKNIPVQRSQYLSAYEGPRIFGLKSKLPTLPYRIVPLGLLLGRVLKKA